MNERYTRLYSLPENLYTEGSPVVIAAGALLKDNQTGKVLAQLKLHSISSKTIIAVKVCLYLFDTAGNPIGDTVAFDYLDLSAAREAEFGQKTPIMVPESKARLYTASVMEVIFSDKTVWKANGTEWEALPKQRTLESVLQDTELVRQYKIAVGRNVNYFPSQEKDLWFCTCGAFNRIGKSCHVCGWTLPELQAIDRIQLVRDKDTRLTKEAKQAAAEKSIEDARNKKTAKILKIVILVTCVVIAIVILVNSLILPTMEERAALKKMEEVYNTAIALMEEGKYEEAITAFEAVREYRDSESRIQESKDTIENLRLQSEYAVATVLFESGKVAEAAISFGSLGDYQDARQRSMELWNAIVQRDSISAGSNHTIGLNSDGTVVVAGSNVDGKCNVSTWKDIVAVSAGYCHTAGLKANGTVVAVGSNDNGQCDVWNWKDIVAISAGEVFLTGGHTVGLKSDGTVVAVGDNYHGQCDVSSWRDIVAISAGGRHTVGLKSDGTVVTVGSNSEGQCDVSGWRDIVAISAGNLHTVGLKADGTVVAVGYNGYKNSGQCDVSSWRDIVAISAGGGFTVGLKSDGTVVAVGSNSEGQCDVNGWRDIVAISAGGGFTVGLKSDGTVVTVGSNSEGQCDVSHWTNMQLVN